MSVVNAGFLPTMSPSYEVEDIELIDGQFIITTDLGNDNVIYHDHYNDEDVLVRDIIGGIRTVISGLNVSSRRVNIATTDWDSTTHSVEITCLGVTSSSPVIIKPTKTYNYVYATAGLSIQQTQDKLTITYTNTPTSDISVDILWFVYDTDYTIVGLPTVTVGSYVYNGQPQGPEITDLDLQNVTVTNAKNIEVGSYVMTIALRDKTTMRWSDFTTQDLTYNYTISSPTTTLYATPDTLSLDTDNPTGDFVITYNGDGELTVTSANTDIATVALVSGRTYRVTGVGSGTVTINISASGTSTYDPATATVDVTVSMGGIYGVYWDGTSSSSWTRTDGASTFVDPVPYYSGMSGSPSSPFDTISPWKDMEIISDSNAGSVVKIPKFWYKWTRSGSTMKLQIANTAEQGFYVSPAHADRGDGQGERDYIYVGRYHCANSTYKSTTGVQPQTSQTRATFRSSIHSLGSTVWQWDFATFWTIRMLYLVEYADWNCQTKIGYGCSPSNAIMSMGYTDSMPYHTGTTATSRETYGGTQYRYIEGLWDNVYDWCDGIYFSSTSVYCIKNPSAFSDTNGGTLVGTRASTSGVTTSWTSPSASGFEYALYPSATTSDSTYSTYSCDNSVYDASGVVLYVGGNYGQYLHYGLFYLNGGNAASYSYTSIGSRLLVLP